MFGWLKDIFNGIIMLVDFVISFISDIIYIIQLTAQFVLDIPSYFAWLPDPVFAMIATIFAIVVVYKVLGREG